MKPDSIDASVPPRPSIRAIKRRRLALDAVGQLLDRVGAAERVDGIGHAALPRDDLLRPQRDRRRLLGRQRHRFVPAVAVERLRAAHHRRQRLDGDADDVVVGLLRRQRAAGRLRVEPELLGAGIAWRRSGPA